MRRVKDNWVNATQILKCCNFPKAKRTKILEKGVQQGLHEKIQGGYGRFQGTWIPLEDAQQLAANYGLSPEMAPVLYLDLDMNTVLPKKARQLNKDGTPVKRKYVKRSKPGDTPSKKPRNDMDSSMNQEAYRMQLMAAAQPRPGPTPAPIPQTGMPYQNYQNDFIGGMVPPAVSQSSIQSEYQNYQLQFQRMQQQQQSHPQPALPQQASFYPPQQPMLNYQHTKASLSQSTNETNWSYDEHKDSDTSESSNDGTKGKNTESYASQILRFFTEENAPVPFFIHNPPYDFNINEAIDDEGHTALHWAASIGNYHMTHLLISKGANPLEVNNFGLNPLSKLILFNNCFEMKNFPKMLDELELCLINTDSNGRTPIHYLCQFSSMESKYESFRYYLSVMVAKLTSILRADANSVNLLKNVLDHQDVNRDTCLHLAARAGSAKLVRKLLSHGARDDLPNVQNETAKQLIMKLNIMGDNSNQLLLVTPMQPLYNAIHTPDTQRTTLQEEGDDDKIKLDDNKENIFMDETMKSSFEAMSTPTPDKNGLHPTNRPLTIISERTVESTPIKGEDHKVSLGAAITQTYSPHPPKLDKDGKVVEDHGSRNLSMQDLSSMVNGMLNALSDSYNLQLAKLKQQQLTLESTIAEKREINEKSEQWLNTLFQTYFDHVESNEQGKQLTDEKIKEYEDTIGIKVQSLQRTLEKKDAYRLANMVEVHESQINDETSPDDSKKFELATKLTKLQYKRSRLLTDTVAAIKNYGIDSKLYKYKKLISLSSNLKVEDIDGLIDGIEESLMEAS